MDMATIQARVERGAAWFDQHYPGWAGKIDLTVLDMESTTRCMGAQVAGTRHEYPGTKWGPRYSTDINEDGYRSGWSILLEDHPEICRAGWNGPVGVQDGEHPGHYGLTFAPGDVFDTPGSITYTDAWGALRDAWAALVTARRQGDTREDPAANYQDGPCGDH